MKILLAAPPFSGHLHPIIGIAKRLVQDNDLHVTIVSTQAAQKRVEQENIHFISILNGYDEKIEKIANPETKVKSNPFKLYKQLKENISILEQLKKEFENIVNDIKPDLMIADFTLPVVGIVAKEKGIKWYTTLPSPCVYECDGVPAYLGGLYPPKNEVERFKYKILNQGIKIFKKSCYWLFKKEFKKIGLNSLYDRNGTELIYSPERVYALGIKELEFNQPKQPQFNYVGPVLYSPRPKYEKEIKYQKNKTYILITMGTHLKFLKKELIKNIQLLAKEYPEIEFHITIGEENNNTYLEQGNVKVLNYISYDKYLSQYHYVIHHGGTGILYECIKRGIPSMVFPQDYDQFDNAARLDYHKLSIRIHDYKHLFLCIQRVLGDDKLLEKNRYFQKIYNTYQAENEIYKEIKLLEIQQIKNC